MAAIKKKICMLGAFAVGKTSLVRRFVTGIFSEKYLTTLGVKIDKKTVMLEDQEVDLMLWDIHGDDEFQKIKSSYLRGTSGYLLVVDGTRGNTLDIALEINRKAEEAIGRVPFILVFNKSDMEDWAISDAAIEALLADGFMVIKTSAKTGSGVEDMFMALARRISNG